MWSSTKKLRIDRSLYRRLAAVAEAAGYASTQELITHVLERAADHSDTSADDNADSNSHPGDGVISNAAADAEVEKQLRGLGYLE